MRTDFELRAGLEALLVVAETPLNLLTIAGHLRPPSGKLRKKLTPWLQTTKPLMGARGAASSFVKSAVAGDYM